MLFTPEFPTFVRLKLSIISLPELFIMNRLLRFKIFFFRKACLLSSFIKPFSKLSQEPLVKLFKFKFIFH